MKRLIFILPILFVCFSCTVTKRVHRPGFHIQWRSFQRTDVVSTEQKEEASIDHIERKRIGKSVGFGSAQPPDLVSSVYGAQSSDLERLVCGEQSVGFGSAQPPDVGSKRSAHGAQLPGLENSKYDAQPPDAGSTSSVFGAESPDVTSATERSRSNAEEREIKAFTTRPILWRLSPSTLKKMGIVFICIGIFLLLGSLMVAVGAFSVNDSGNGAAWFNFFLDLISISGWFWILAFILLLIFALYLSFLFVKYVMGGALLGLIVGASFLILGIFFYALGKSREVEP